MLLLNAPAPVWAAGKKASAKPAAARPAVSRHARRAKSAHRGAHPSVAAETFGPADLRDENPSGLRGQASFYGQSFQGRQTSTGEIFDAGVFSAASNRFPLGTLLAVWRIDNDRCAIVRVNDRMHRKHRKRIIDVSRSVAEYLDMIRAGVVMVRVVPLSERASGDTESCRRAFEPASECSFCTKTERLPDFQGGMDE